MIRFFATFTLFLAKLTDALERNESRCSEAQKEADRLKEERDLRYTYDLVERIFERRRQQNDSLNAALLGLIAVNVAFLVLFLDRLCTVGPVPTLGLILSTALVVIGILGELEELDVELLVYDLANDPAAAISNRIGVLVDNTKTLARSARRKQWWALAASAITALAVAYSFDVTFAQGMPLWRYAGCVATRETAPKVNMGFHLQMPYNAGKP